MGFNSCWEPKIPKDPEDCNERRIFVFKITTHSWYIYVHVYSQRWSVGIFFLHWRPFYLIQILKVLHEKLKNYLVFRIKIF